MTERRIENTGKIKYVKGDATKPEGEGNKVIIHCCNDIGGWGSGFVVALSKRWPTAEKCYREWHRHNEVLESEHVTGELNDFALGEAQFVWVDGDPEENDAIWIGNMIGQRSTGHSPSGEAPIRYEAIGEALKKVYKFAKEHDASVHAPRFGAGLAGGDWDIIEKLIKKNLADDRRQLLGDVWKDVPGVEVTIYDFE